ncbi:stromal interaction molecule 2 isoform X1 [Cololabis saira]|uniref:stromal interaction molecule 2 isoform X1 n=2 Tax=Cololabis saira TaxID=129043 RepID=UPI002AD57763|nr:stromal interaction molecule 2 isoform X1 [Cololabis saira]
MLPLCPLLLILPAAVFVAAHGAGDAQSFSSSGGGAAFEPPDPCLLVTPPCLGEADRFSLEALRSIHHMMDDDQDGGIEVEESMEFIIEDMKQQQQTHKHSNLHREDQHITVEELWRGWKSSEVHNWTQEEVLRWLKEFVELPQYERNFKDLKVNGNTLPRIAANEPSFLSGQLKVQDQRDKQKLNIKALDAVLFGPPTRPPHNYMKDMLLIVSVVMGVGGCWFAQAQNKASKVHITKMMKDLESLQRAEESLTDIQEQLEQAQEEKRNVAEEKQNLEEKMRDEIMGAQEEAHRLYELRRGAVTELSRLRYAEEELVQVRGALMQAEHDMMASWTVSETLQQWLQLTHEVEVQYYNVKKQSAEQQLATAKEEAERIKKKRSSVLGTLHMAHGSSLDQVDHKIMGAKNALSEVTACLRERLHRWQQIELLCGFPIIRNPGLGNLTAQLYSEKVALGLPRVLQSSCSCHSSIHGSIENLIDEPPMMQQMPVHGPQLKCSPRPQGSSMRRPRRPGVLTQSSAAKISPDPDLLIPIRAPYPTYEEEEELFLKTLKKQDSQEKFFDLEYMSSPSLNKIIPSSTVDSSSRKSYYDELPADTKPFSKEVETAAESPVCKMSVEKHEKSLDPSLETPSFKISAEEPFMNATSMKIIRDRNEVPMDVAIRKGILNELDAEFSPWKIETDTAGDLMDSHSRPIYRERSSLQLDLRKNVWTELEPSTDKPRKISRDMMGGSMDSAAKKMTKDNAEHLTESKRMTRELMGMSQDIPSSRKLIRSKGERHLDSSVSLAKDKLADTARIPPRKISRDELEYHTDTSPMKMLPRETFEALMEASTSTDMHEYGLEPVTVRGLLRHEPEVSAGSLRRRLTRMPSSADILAGSASWDRVDTPIEIPKQPHLKLREELGALESSSLPCRTGQPDLMLTSQVPWKSSSDLGSVGPLNHIVYDGILEKSCNSVPSTPTSPTASTPHLPQSRPLTEVESPIASPKAVLPSLASPPEGGDDKHKEKEKSKKSSKLKNLFKKKNESHPEKLQSGLQKL